jgi:hypothetical protein
MLNMKETFVAAVLISAALSAGPATAVSAAYLDARTLNTISSRFSELIELANRHDLKALHGMFWQSPSVLLVAKSAIPSEGNWAGFWGNDAICRTRRGAKTLSDDHQLDKGGERLEDRLRDHPAGPTDTGGQGLRNSAT